MKRTNVLLSDEQHKNLKKESRRSGRSLGELVRNAVGTTYGTVDPIEKRRTVAVNAYQEGLISLGRLAEILGTDPVAARQYLRDRGMRIRTQSAEEAKKDAASA